MSPNQTAVPAVPTVPLPELVDITAPNCVSIMVSEDRRRLWVNVNDRCVLRCCQIGDLDVTLLESQLGGGFGPKSVLPEHETEENGSSSQHPSDDDGDELQGCQP